MVYGHRSEAITGLAELAGTIAHELNNVFTAVSGNLSVLDEELHLTGPAAETVDEIVRAAQRGITLSERLQAFAGRQPLKRRKLDIGKILAESADRLRAVFPNLNISVSFPRMPAIVYVDEEKMHTTLQELAANAAAATNGCGDVHICTTQKSLAKDNCYNVRVGSYIVIQVSDNGPGMDAETARRAAEPAFSTRSPSIERGWGLSSSTGFIRQCAGMTRLSTAEGRGTAVQIFLPIETVIDITPDLSDTDPVTATYQRLFPAPIRPVVFHF